MKNLSQIPTYIYIDASNIKNALNQSEVNLDYIRLFEYLNDKYKKLQVIKYFEGIETTDDEKRKKFNTYTKLDLNVDIKSLERKSYLDSAKFRMYICTECGTKNEVEILSKKRVLKSNVDVYLTSEIFSDILNKINNDEAHLIIFSCDGDFAEPIKKILDLKENIYFSVFATPYTKSNKYLSIRLKQLEQMDRYHLVNILNIKDKIKSKESSTEV